jgi:ABC-type transport system involved in multi-copper enzyme maturation permease subunit
MTFTETPSSSPLPAGTRSTPRSIPLSRVVTTEVRKMLDTRSGFWLIAGLGILALLATGAVIVFATNKEPTYDSFVTAIGIPLTLVLPMIAILSVSSEWSQRSGLTTFTLVPHRGRVITAKAIASVGIAVVSMPLAFGIGALGNVARSVIAGTYPVWDLTLPHLLTIALANILSLLVGFMLGVLIRSSAGALVAYFIYQFLLPTLALPLAASQNWFRDLQPWVDFDHAQGALFDGALSTQQWAQLGVTGVIWLAIPLTIGLRFVTRAEVK